ncbi:Transposase IS66 family protein [compost metagenome]
MLHADETPLSILSPGEGKVARGYLWAYASAEATGHALVWFDCQPGRSGQYARAALDGWQGTLVVDDYAGYKALFAQSGIQEAACWAHVRRKFFEQFTVNKGEVAQEALNRIRVLYQLERKIKHRTPENRRRWRQRYAKPALVAFHAWLLSQHARTPAGSGIYKAIGYTLKRWPALQCYLDDGRVPIDNNRIENAIRPVAVGRKNWLFAGSLPAGQRMATLLSLLETARQNGLEPFIWLRDVLTRLPTWPNSRLRELLPYPENTFT